MNFFHFFSFILETLICHFSSTSHSPLQTQISCVLCRTPCISFQSGTLWFRRVGYMMCVLRHCAFVYLYPHGILSRSMWFLTREPCFECNTPVFLYRSETLSCVHMRCNFCTLLLNLMRVCESDGVLYLLLSEMLMGGHETLNTLDWFNNLIMISRKIPPTHGPFVFSFQRWREKVAIWRGTVLKELVLM